MVHAHDLGDLIADREHRVERGHRLLEHHRHASAANLAHRLFVERDEVVSVEVDLAAGLDSAGRADEAEQRERGDRFSAARFADEPDRLAGADVEADAVHRAGDAVLGVEVRAEIANAQERLRHSR